jgi:hypothetical protein
MTKRRPRQPPLYIHRTTAIKLCRGPMVLTGFGMALKSLHLQTGCFWGLFTWK